MLKEIIPLNDVKLEDREVLRRQNNTVKYLLSLKPEKFLYTFYQVAGIKPLADNPYAGWERTDGHNFRGHFFGHYLLALSQAVNVVADENIRQQLLLKLKTSIKGLSKAQSEYGKKYPQSIGYVSAFNEVALDKVEGKDVPNDQKENVLVPWYDLHKILAGLIGCYQNLQSYDKPLAKQALQVASNFGDYVYNRVSKLADPTIMLKTEYGGMNDALYQLFEITKSKKQLKAATYFDEVSLFKELAQGHDVLAGKHANTTIPKLIGALKRYELFSNANLAATYLNDIEKRQLDMYLKAAINFWQIVVSHHTYATGGNSQSEHFHQANQLYHDAFEKDGATTCETCNVYNMLKLTRELYRVTGKKSYLDYYDQTYTNAILGSQNPVTGMMTYFQPMGAGYNKIFNRPYDEFWCCTGTGIESFTKLTDSYYFRDKKYLYLIGFFSNDLILRQDNLLLKLRVNRSRGKITIKLTKLNSSKPCQSINLAIRKPDWIDKFTVNDDYDADEDYIYLKNINASFDSIIEYHYRMQIIATPDNPHYIAFKYGPYVLAALFNQYHINDDRPNGILVRIATHDVEIKDTLTTLI